MRFAKFDKQLTKEAKFRDRRSKIGRRADGSLRYDLAGKDKMALRERILERDNWACVDSTIGQRLHDVLMYERKPFCEGPLEMSHWPPMSKSGGSDEMASCFCRCRKHHRLLDNSQVKWSQKP